MRTTATKLRESLHAASMRLVDAEQRNAALEASLQAQRAQSENDRLELLARTRQLEEEQQARAPKVYHEDGSQSRLVSAVPVHSTPLGPYARVHSAGHTCEYAAGLRAQVLQRFLTSSKRPGGGGGAGGAAANAWAEERNQLLKQVRALETEQRRLLELCASLETGALEHHRTQLLVLEGYTQQLEADNLELSNRFAEVRHSREAVCAKSLIARRICSGSGSAINACAAQSEQNAWASEELRRELQELTRLLDSQRRASNEECVAWQTRVELLRLALANAEAQMATLLEQVRT